VGDLLEAIGDEQDELFAGMLDAVDCFQASTFDSLHGYYRSALSNLRSALELVAIGSLGNLSPNDSDYLRWKKQNVPLRRNGNWKMASRDPRPKPAPKGRKCQKLPVRDRRPPA
jgi:hypothetical protein